MIMSISIVEYQPAFREAVRRLNEAWLSAYFVVEPSDRVQLGDPETHILQKGGYLCFAATDEAEVVGVGALMWVKPGVYELSKMAVDPAFQGCGIGRRIAVRCLQEARQRGASRVILYTNSRLQAAIHLYESLGFVSVPLREAPYGRADRRMELELAQPSFVAEQRNPSQA